MADTAQQAETLEDVLMLLKQKIDSGESLKGFCIRVKIFGVEVELCVD